MSGHVAIAVLVAGVAGCASATQRANDTPDAPNGTKLDASHAIDAPRLTDAGHELDAPHTPVDAPQSSTCTTSVTCTTATMLAGIGGDETGASTSSASGYQAAWYSIRVSETDNGPFADPMSMQATLTSPTGVMFDLQVYVPGDATSNDCTSPTGTVSTSGNIETWSLEWGETGVFANGIDDSRTIAIQITPRSGDTCAAAETWSLAIVTGFD